MSSSYFYDSIQSRIAHEEAGANSGFNIVIVPDWDIETLYDESEAYGVFAFTPDKYAAGQLFVEVDGDGESRLSADIDVDPEFQRQGVASDLYGVATRYLNVYIEPGDFTDEGEAFWEGRKEANILDPISETLDPRLWDDPGSKAPKFKDVHREWVINRVFEVLEEGGYDGMEGWLDLVFTGSHTTYQYSDESDIDISLFVDAEVFPEWSRAEMIGLVIDNIDGVPLPGTPFPMQCFVVPPDVSREDLYQPGMRSGYDLIEEMWVVPPDRNRAHDVEKEMKHAYTQAIENADKMDRLLRYEPEKAVKFYKQCHRRRGRDMKDGKGDYTPSNITYKMLNNRGYFQAIMDANPEVYIA